MTSVDADLRMGRRSYIKRLLLKLSIYCCTSYHSYSIFSVSVLWFLWKMFAWPHHFTKREVWAHVKIWRYWSHTNLNIKQSTQIVLCKMQMY